MKTRSVFLGVCGVVLYGTLAVLIFSAATSVLELWLGAHAAFCVLSKSLGLLGERARRAHIFAQIFGELLIVVTLDAVTLARSVQLPTASAVFCSLLLLKVCIFYVAHHAALCIVFTQTLRDITEASGSPRGVSQRLDNAMLSTVSNMFSFTPPQNAAVSGETPEACSICLVDYEEGDQVRSLNGCAHKFHLECIDKWLERSSQCPLCRADLAVGAAGVLAGAVAAARSAAEISGQPVVTTTNGGSSRSSASSGRPRRVRSGRRRHGGARYATRATAAAET